MNCIKTLNELLTKTLYVVLFFLMSKVGYGQLGQVVALTLPSVDTYIEEIDVVGINQTDVDGNYHEVEYMVDLNVDINLGFIDETSVTEIVFDIEVGGFDTWSIDQGDFELTETEAQTTVTPNDTNPNLYHISTTFSDGVDNSSLAMNIIRTATSALAIEDRPEMQKTYDCFDYHVEQTATVEISNMVISGNNLAGNPSNITVMGDAYAEDFALPSCIGKGYQVGANEYNVNLMIKEMTDTYVNVDVYMSYLSEVPIVSGGIVLAAEHTHELEHPVFSSSSLIDCGINSFLNYSVIDFTNVSLPENSVDQIYLGTLTFNYAHNSNKGDNVIESGFYVLPSSEVYNENGDELLGVALGDDDPTFIEVEAISYNLSMDEITNSDEDIGLSKTPGKQLANMLSLSPNPANHRLTITYSVDIKDAEIYIYNMEGRTVEYLFLGDIESNVIHVDISDWITGTYLINTIAKEQVYQDKFIVKR